MNDRWARLPWHMAARAGAAIGGDFVLTASDGRTVKWADFAGKYRVVYFGYAFCPDICPTDMQRVAQGLKVLKGEDPEARIRDLMKKREQAYLQAGIAVYTDGRSLQQLCVIVERVYEREVRAALKGPGKRRD